MIFSAQNVREYSQGLGINTLQKDVCLFAGIEDHWENNSVVPKDKINTIRGAVLEQRTVYLQIPVWKFWVWRKYVKDPKAMVVFARFSMFITLDYSLAISNSKFAKDLLKYMCADNVPTSFHKHRRTVLICTSRSVLAEFRDKFNPQYFSIACENPGKRDYSDNFNFIAPMWFDSSKVQYDSNDIPVQVIGGNLSEQEFARSCYEVEMHYSSLKSKGLNKEQLSNILPGSMATTTIITASEDAWKAAIQAVSKDKDSAEFVELMTKIEKTLKLFVGS